MNKSNGRFYLNLFTEETYAAFVSEQGSSESGFPATRKNWAKKLRPGDFLVCYAVGKVKKFFGILEVNSKVYEKHDSVWDGRFPIRVKVKPLTILEPKAGVPIQDLLPRLEEYQKLRSKNRWSILVRGSLREIKGNDSITITEAINKAKATTENPIKKKSPIEIIQHEQPTSNEEIKALSLSTTTLDESQREFIKRQIRNLDEIKDIIPKNEFKIRLGKLIDSYQYLQ